MKAAFLPLYKQSVRWGWGENGNKKKQNPTINLGKLGGIWLAPWVEHVTLDMGGRGGL